MLILMTEKSWRCFSVNWVVNFYVTFTSRTTKQGFKRQHVYHHHQPKALNMCKATYVYMPEQKREMINKVKNLNGGPSSWINPPYIMYVSV